jgi:pyruvate dehydrogenase phosphatase
VADDGLLWDVALKAHASGDYSVAVAQANEALEDQAQVLVSPASTLVGVYDGHGGPDAARFVNARLFSLIQGTNCLLRACASLLTSRARIPLHDCSVD